MARRPVILYPVPSHRDMVHHLLSEQPTFRRLSFPFAYKSLEKQMTDQSMRHLERLNEVVDGDTAHIIDKERTYRGSWKRRGGVGVFMMLARKWDRLENMLKGDMMVVQAKAEEDTPLGETLIDGTTGDTVFQRVPEYDLMERIPEYDLFERIRHQVGDQPIPKDAPDGTILAEIRDLRRYLILVEAELLRKSHDEHDDLQSRRSPSPTAQENLKTHRDTALNRQRSGATVGKDVHVHYHQTGRGTGRSSNARKRYEAARKRFEDQRDADANMGTAHLQSHRSDPVYNMGPDVATVQQGIDQTCEDACPGNLRTVTYEYNGGIQVLIVGPRGAGRTSMASVLASKLSQTGIPFTVRAKSRSTVENIMTDQNIPLDIDTMNPVELVDGANDPMYPSATKVINEYKPNFVVIDDPQSEANDIPCGTPGCCEHNPIDPTNGASPTRNYVDQDATTTVREEVERREREEISEDSLYRATRRAIHRALRQQLADKTDGPAPTVNIAMTPDLAVLVGTIIKDHKTEDPDAAGALSSLGELLTNTAIPE